MKKTLFFLCTMCFAALSCTKEKTDYEAVLDPASNEHMVFKEATTAHSGGYDITIETLNGTFYKGYNEIHLNITNSATHEKAVVSAVTFLPIMTNGEGADSSCPHRYELVYRPDNSHFTGYSVFTSESNTDETWALDIHFTIADQTHNVKQPITVREQTNKNLNMTAFTGKDGEQYIIALVGPKRPKVAENELVAGIYRLNGQGASPLAYTEVSGFTLMLDPRMPEPSMGNHSSPNNKDLAPQNDGLYHGVVNYTMTGNWTLNFIMLNEKGRILKGTEVPPDFTPGVGGVKSELYIDVLF